MRGLWLRGEPFERTLAFGVAVFLHVLAEPIDRAGLMLARIEDESAALLWLVDGPAGHDFGEIGDVGLRVSAIDADSVEFHDFAAVIFVEAALLFWRDFRRPANRGRCWTSCRDSRAWRDAAPWPAAGRGICRGHVRGWRRAHRWGCTSGRLFAEIDVEVVVPEVGHDFLQLALAQDRAQHLRLL